MAYCAPANLDNYKKDKTCFDKPALERLAAAWNELSPHNKITGIPKLSKRKLWSLLNERMRDTCGNGKEWCWVDKLGKEKQHLRPATPREWYKQPYAWLSNYDIDAVMRQYESDKSNKYVFLGVYPIDFAAKSMFGTCLFKEMCGLDVVKYIKRGIKYVGMITNLDRHDQDGSHWTSLFVCIDPKMPCFGAYYYDSVSRRYPPEILEFINVLKMQCEAYAKSIGVDATFKMDYNKVQHQFKNTECGVFSMAYQIRWLTKLKVNKHTTFKDVVQVDIDDDEIHKLRKKLFRPNTAVEAKGSEAKGNEVKRSEVKRK